MSDMYLQQHQVHVKTKPKTRIKWKRMFSSSRSGHRRQSKGGCWAVRNRTSVHAAYTDWFYLPEQPAEPPKPWRHKDVSADREETQVRGKTGGKLVQMQKTSQKQTSSWDLQCSQDPKHSQPCMLMTNKHTIYNNINSYLVEFVTLAKNTTTESDPLMWTVVGFLWGTLS